MCIRDRVNGHAVQLYDGVPATMAAVGSLTRTIDVYKIQQIPLFRRLQGQLIVLPVVPAHKYGTVSYPHLDVYKRQLRSAAIIP